jgi:hypothetical protein
MSPVQTYRSASGRLENLQCQSLKWQMIIVDHQYHINDVKPST